MREKRIKYFLLKRMWKRKIEIIKRKKAAKKELINQKEITLKIQLII
jgi:hypothetical protein